MVVGAVEAAGPAVHRLEQVDPPDRLADPDRRGGVDRSPEFAPVEDPEFEPDPMLGPLLPGTRVRVKEVEVTHDDADSFEHEGLQHDSTISRSTTERPARVAGGRCAHVKRMRMHSEFIALSGIHKRVIGWAKDGWTSIRKAVAVNGKACRRKAGRRRP